MLTNEILQKVIKAFDDNSTTGVIESFTEDGKWEMMGHEVMNGRKGIQEFFDNNPGSKMISSTKDHIVIEGDTAVVDGFVTCHGPDGKTIEMFYCDLYEFTGDKVRSLRSYCIPKK